MKIHHLNCATMCPPAPAGFLNPERKMVCHCLLVETGDGLVLVDTGLGLDDVATPVKRLGGSFVRFTRPALDANETAARQVEKLGFTRRDVRHIVVTHLDLDHAGGLSDFPEAQVHLYATELDAALARRHLKERERYKPIQWAHGPLWDPRKLTGERWFGFDAVRAVPKLEDSVLIVPTVGHTRGHAAIAVRGDAGWLLHCGDAYFYRDEMDPVNPHATPGLRFFQWLIQMDGEARLRNQARLRELARDHGQEVRVFSAHDPAEYARMTRPS